MLICLNLIAVFPTSTKDSSEIGLDGLKRVCDAIHIPVVAIGGIKHTNAGSCIEAGAKGVAVVSAIFGADDVKEAT